MKRCTLYLHMKIPPPSVSELNRFGLQYSNVKTGQFWFVQDVRQKGQMKAAES